MRQQGRHALAAAFGVLALAAMLLSAVPAATAGEAAAKPASRSRVAAASRPTGAPADSDSIVRILGAWHGRSDCVEKGGSCHDEIVQYHFTAAPGEPDSVSVDAEKLVAGRYGSMGVQTAGFDPKTRTWTAEFQNSRTHVLTRFQIVNGELVGSMVDFESGKVLRRMRAKRGLDPAVRQ